MDADRPESIEAEINMRGFVIKTAVGVESFLIVIILHCAAPYSVGKKETEEFKIRRLTFGEVVAKARKLLKKYYPDLHKEYKTFLNDIDSFVNFRNRFAHYPILWDDRKAGTFSFQETKVNADNEEYLHYIKCSRMEMALYMKSIYDNVMPPLIKLSSEVRDRLKVSHPEIHAAIQQAYNEDRRNSSSS